MPTNTSTPIKKCSIIYEKNIRKKRFNKKITSIKKLMAVKEHDPNAINKNFYTVS